MGDMVFYLFALMTVLSGFFVVFSKNIVHAGFSLLFTLLGVAGLFAMLGADFLAVTQTMVYIGGILILVLFVVMMTRIPKQDISKRSFDRKIPAGIFSVLIFAIVFKVISSTEWNVLPIDAPEATINIIGQKLLTDFIFPFEYASIVLLLAMVGAAILIRERKIEDKEEVQS